MSEWYLCFLLQNVLFRHEASATSLAQHPKREPVLHIQALIALVDDVE